MLFQLSAQQQSVGEEEEYEWVDEVKMVPQEVMVEEVVEKVDEVFVTEQREVPTVIARYPFQGQGMNMVKGEVRTFVPCGNPFWYLWQILVVLLKFYLCPTPLILITYSVVCFSNHAVVLLTDHVPTQQDQQ